VSLGLKHVSEAILFPHRAFHILAHQIICLCLQMRGADSDQIWQILSKASCFSKVTRHEFDTMVHHMIQKDYLRLVDHNILIPGSESENDFLRANWKKLFAVFDTGPMYDVVDGKKIIGTLDSGFAREQKLPFVFVLGGLEWNTIKIDHETQQVLVKKNETGIAPKWKAISNFDVPFELAQEIGRLLTSNKVPEFLDPSAQIELRRQQNMHCNLDWNDNQWVIDSSDDEISQIYLWTFSGHKINRALAKILEVEFDIKPRYDHLKIIVELKVDLLKSKGDFHKFFTSLQSRSEDSLEKLLENNTKSKWFSKFSECLPDSLAIKTICEKGMDLSGLIRELNRITVVA
jgi:ATP-dependent Lhr-like helicase